MRSFDSILLQGHWLDVACLKLVLAKALGYATIVGAFGLKVPQILAILKSKDVEGLVPVAMYSEVRSSSGVRLRGPVES